LPQPLEGVGLQQRKAGIQDVHRRREAKYTDARQRVRSRAAAARVLRGANAMTADSASMPSAPHVAWPWRVAGWIATFAAVLVLGYVIAYWGWQWLGRGRARRLAPPPEPFSRQRSCRHCSTRRRADAAAMPAPMQATPACSAFSPAATAPATLCFALGIVDRCWCVRRGNREGCHLARSASCGVRIRDHGETRDLGLRTGAATTRDVARWSAGMVCARQRIPRTGLSGERGASDRNRGAAGRTALLTRPGGLTVRAAALPPRCSA
jgi:hypothetical protein